MSRTEIKKCPFCGKETDKFIMFRGDIVGCRYCGIGKMKNWQSCGGSVWTAENTRYIEIVKITWQDCKKLALDWLKQEADHE